MTHFDAFNGDADGLCALHQLRLAAAGVDCLPVDMLDDFISQMALAYP